MDNSQYYVLDGIGDENQTLFIYILRVKHKFLFESEDGEKYSPRSPLNNIGYGTTKKEAFESFKKNYFLTLKDLQTFGEKLRKNNFEETFVEKELL